MLTTPSARLRARRGLTMAELLITLVILGLVGTALTKLLVQQGRTFSAQQAQRNARLVSRNSLGIMMSELRMAQDSSGIDSVGTNGAAVRVELPYAFGIACGNVGSATIVQLAPVDSMVTANASPSTYRFRSTTNGRWVTATGGTFIYSVADPLQASACTTAGIIPDTISGRAGLTVALQPAAMVGASAVASGTPVFVAQKIIYKFATSAAYPQGLGLFRVVNGASQELLGPFDASSRFRYYVPNSDVATATAPADLSTIRGLELVLNGMSERDAPNPATGKVEHIVSQVTTGVLFKNTRSF